MKTYRIIVTLQTRERKAIYDRFTENGRMLTQSKKNFRNGSIPGMIWPILRLFPVISFEKAAKNLKHEF